ncbi:hypothetical protein TNCT_479501 [Trichonephila clavata]|uniref:Uncharacterized protein n=1 Tax=Trichonephila clavata TaxID=2740835 RepID=A0A8X6LVA7_TRICU|nr:hypothetical protein TNCT_479501 [Trichonephila clavata]
MELVSHFPSLTPREHLETDDDGIKNSSPHTTRNSLMGWESKKLCLQRLLPIGVDDASKDNNEYPMAKVETQLTYSAKTSYFSSKHFSQPRGCNRSSEALSFDVLPSLHSCLRFKNEL